MSINMLETGASESGKVLGPFLSVSAKAAALIFRFFPWLLREIADIIAADIANGKLYREPEDWEH